MIKAKIGTCIDCPPDSREVPLVAERCQSHYWRYRASLKKDKALKQQRNSTIAPKSAKDVQAQTMGTYFANQAHKMPKYCEETGQLLPTFPAWLKLSCMAHILKKRKGFGFESVATHPLNMCFVMPDIHTNIDNLGEEYIVKLKIYPILKERVRQLLPLLTEKELNKVPQYYL